MAKRYKRRPNGSGSVYKLSGNRRKPYVASVCIGTNAETGKAIQKPIGYFETYEQAENALVMHRLNDNTIFTTKEIKEMPKAMQDTVINFNEHVPTFREVWEDSFDRDTQGLSKSAINQYKTAFNNWKSLHDFPINKITYDMMQNILDEQVESGSKASKLNQMKLAIYKITRNAIKRGYIKKEQDYSSYLEAKPKEKATNKHKPFSLKEITKLFKDNSYASKIVLCLIYTGMRPMEFLKLTKNDIYLDQVSNDNGKQQVISYLIGGMKTESGKNRIIPIHPKIKDFIQEFIGMDKKYLISEKCTADILQGIRDNEFKPLMNKLKMEHELYDTRHTFSTLAKLSKVDEFARKRILGHKSGNITDDIYTHTYKNMLYQEILAIDIC